jgi:hypothetical protein
MSANFLALTDSRGRRRTCRAGAIEFVAGLRGCLQNVRGFYVAHLRISRPDRGHMLPDLPEVPAALRIPRKGRPHCAGMRIHVRSLRELV